MGKGSKPVADHQKAANKATARFNAENDMPEGTQPHHWIKVRDAERTDMPVDRMNKSLAPLQSKTDKPATTLLTSKDGTSGTTYKIHSGVNDAVVKEAALSKFDTRQITEATSPEAKAQAQAEFNILWEAELNKPAARGGTFHTEHKFADGYLMKNEAERQASINPSMNDHDALEAAGAGASWKLIGKPGVVSKELAEQVPISQVHTKSTLAEAGAGTTVTTAVTATGSDNFKPGADPLKVAEWSDPTSARVSPQRGEAASGLSTRSGQAIGVRGEANVQTTAANCETSASASASSLAGIVPRPAGGDMSTSSGQGIGHRGATTKAAAPAGPTGLSRAGIGPTPAGANLSTSSGQGLGHRGAATTASAAATTKAVAPATAMASGVVINPFSNLSNSSGSGSF